MFFLYARPTISIFFSWWLFLNDLILFTIFNGTFELIFSANFINLQSKLYLFNCQEKYIGSMGMQ